MSLYPRDSDYPLGEDVRPDSGPEDGDESSDEGPLFEPIEPPALNAPLEDLRAVRPTLLTIRHVGDGVRERC